MPPAILKAMMRQMLGPILADMPVETIRELRAMLDELVDQELERRMIEAAE